MSLKRFIASAVCIAAASVAQTAAGQTLHNVALMPQYFEPNQGQAERGVDFISRGPGYALSLKPNEADLQLISAPHAPGRVRNAAVRMKLLAANARASFSGQNRQSATSNYLIGNAPESWRTGVPHYARVEYRDVYPGIDLVYYGNQQQLEYDFILGPHADVGRIDLEFQGADDVSIDDATGDVVVRLASGEIRQKAPVVYQKTPGGRRLIDGKYVKRGHNRVGLRVGSYDRTGALIIDPALVFSTYFGGNGTDGVSGIAFDAAGNVYFTGTTSSTNLTGTNLGAGLSSGISAAYVAKMSPAGALIFVTYIAGSNDNATAADVALDASGNIYLVGSTTSTTFPTVNPIQAVYQGGTDAFLMELNSSGNAILFSTYFGGTGYDYFDSMAVDNNGNIYGGGATSSGNFPVQNAAQPTNPVAGSGAYAAFALKVSGTTLSYSTYIGGDDYTNRITIDAQGNLYAVGDVTSASFPTTPNAFQTTYGGATDGFVQKLSPTGAVIYSTYIGGSGTDAVRAVGVDPAGNLIIAGQTLSTDFPVLASIQSTLNGSEDGFVAKLSPNGSTLMFSTYLGGSGDDRINNLALDGAGNVYVTGYTASPDFPTVQPLQGQYGGGAFDAFLTEIDNSGSTIQFSTYLGGSGDDEGNTVRVVPGTVYIAGRTASVDFPLLNALQTQFGGGSYDGFIAGVAVCAYTLSPTGAPLGLAGGSGSFTITTSPACNWTAATSSPWITIMPPVSGSGSGTINYSAAPATIAQQGTITINGQPFTIVESGPVTLTSVLPTVATLGSTVSVTLGGTNFVSGATVSVNNPGVTVSNVVVVSDTEITATFTISSSAALGTASVTVTTLAGSSSLTNLTITQPPVYAASVMLSPASVVGGISTTANTVTLTGPAPSGGALVTLMSGNPVAATVPASVTVAAGATVSPAFTIGTTAVMTTTPVTISATYGTTVTATLSVTPPPASGSPVLQLNMDSAELSGTQNGATVTPTIALSGFTGKVVVNGSGSVNFTPAESGNGAYFLNCCANTNDAYYQFTGAGLGNIFGVNQGEITFYLQSRYTFAQRKANAAGQRYAYDVRDGNGNHLFSFMTQVSSGYLLFTYMAGGVSSYYYVPSGTEDTLFGNGVVLQVTMAWGSRTSNLYLNGTLVKSAGYTAPAANWSAAPNFDLGAFQYLSYGGYNSSDDAIADFTVLASPLLVSMTAPAAGTAESGTVAVTANATDIVPLTSVQFTLDGANLGSAVTGAGPGYSFNWDTTTATNGPHTLAAVATDSAGNSSSSAGVSVTVNNVTTPPTVSAVTLSPASVLGGTSTTLNTVTLSGPAPNGGAVVTLMSNNPAATVPASVTVAGAATVSPAFTIMTTAVAVNTPVTISATYGGVTLPGTLTVQAPSPSAVTLSPASVLGGTSTTLNTVTLNGPAPAGGVVVTLMSNNPGVAAVPASVTVAGGATVSPAFTITTSSVSSATPVSISASYNGVSVPATLTVGPLTASVVTLTSSSVLGGVSTTATVSLNGPAPAGGAVVTLTSSDPSTTVPASVTVAGGATVSPSFPITTIAVTASLPVTISASYNGPAATAILTVLPPSPSAVTLSPASVMGGVSTTANTVTLSGPAASTGAVVTLMSNNPAATVPASVTVAGGATVSPVFTITTTAVAANTPVTISATYGGVTATGTLTVQPPSPSTVTLSPASVLGGTPTTLNTITLNGPAPAAGAVVTLMSNNPAATVAVSVTVAGGATVSPAFTITTTAVAANTPVTISATYGGVTLPGTLTVLAPSPSAVTLSPASVVGGTSTTLNTVTLNGPAPAGGAVVTLMSNNPSVATVPASVTVAGGATVSPAFTIMTSSVSAATLVSISASYNGVTVPATLTVGPLTASVVTLTSSSVLGGVSTTATVSLNGPAPAGGAVVTLMSSDPSTTVPASVTVAGGATVSPAFTVATTVVATTTSVTISATYNGGTATATLTVTPPPASGSPVLQLHLDASEISGTQNGATVTPSTGPAGMTGTVVVHSGGSVNFAPAESGNGAYFLNCCNNSNNAYYKFTGTALGNVFNVNQGQIAFYLESRYTFAQRKANAAGQRYAFDVRDGNGNHQFNFMTQVSSGYLLFTYTAGGVTSYYYVPAGTEDTLFGNGVIMQVMMAWGSGVNNLYLNGKLVKSVGFTAPSANWSAASNFDLGAYEYLTYGGYNSSDDVIDEFTVVW